MRVSRLSLAALFLGTVFVANGLESDKAQAGMAFDDEFETGGLNREWSWENPGGSSLYTVSGGLFNLVVTPNNDQWSGIDRGARVLKAQSSPNWTIETKRFTSSGNAASFGGLTVFKDSRNWISLGWLQESSIEFSGIIDGAFTTPLGVSSWYDYLRIRKAGNRYYADVSGDGRNWTNVNMFMDSEGALSGARIGLLAKNWGAIGPYSLSVEYFREHDQDMLPASLTRVQSTRRIAQLTGPESSNRTERFNVCGADYGIMFGWQGRTYLAFGDTRSCRLSADSRPNTLAFSTDNNPTDGLRLDGWVTDARGEAKTLFVADGDALTAVPTAGIALGDTAFIFYANIARWDDAPGAWDCNSSSVASANARDQGAWSKHIDGIAWGAGGFNQLAVLRDPAPGSTVLYFFGTPCGRSGSVKLMTVDEANVLDRGAYRYFAGLDGNGNPVWSSDESQAKSVAGGPAGELSAVFNPYLQRYTLTYLDQGKEGIVMRQAELPWGPWSPPTVIARNADYRELYGAFTSAAFLRSDGRVMYYTMSQFDPYNTYLMETILP